MSGAYRRLRPGRYQLVVNSGQGPAGVRRPGGANVAVGVEGGATDFRVKDDERVYYWWRGPSRPAGVRLIAERRSPLARPLRRSTQLAAAGD